MNGVQLNRRNLFHNRWELNEKKFRTFKQKKGKKLSISFSELDLGKNRPIKSWTLDLDVTHLFIKWLKFFSDSSYINICDKMSQTAVAAERH